MTAIFIFVAVRPWSLIPFLVRNLNINVLSISNVCVCSAGITRLPVLEGEISHIEIPRLTTNLGITIVGGADTALVSSAVTSSHVVHLGPWCRTGNVVFTSHCLQALIRCVANATFPNSPAWEPAFTHNRERKFTAWKGKVSLRVRSSYWQACERYE